jgi:tryptophanyl-tRNA synthetase
VARRFNHFYGREPDFEANVETALKKMGIKGAALFLEMRKRYQEEGDQEALETGRAFLEEQQNISLGDRERLLGHLEGFGKVILPEPRALLTPQSKMPGLDGEKMSKSYGNTIGLREAPDLVIKKLKTMPTDPARGRRTDPGDPAKCPVWKLHEVYTDEAVREWAANGCRTAGIGCLECKQPVIDAVLAEQAPIRERALKFAADPDMVYGIIDKGCESARAIARETLEEVRSAMGLSGRCSGV